MTCFIYLLNKLDKFTSKRINFEKGDDRESKIRRPGGDLFAACKRMRANNTNKSLRYE